MYHFTDLAAAQEVLEQFLPAKTPRPAYTLDHVRAFLDHIGNPQNKVKAIHIAGTSGKTSTAYYTAALLGSSGKNVGLLISPHIHALNERVQIKLVPLNERVFCDDLAIFMDLVEQSTIRLTYAELLYAFGYWEFARQRVDYMVIETGLGGTLDATNVIDRQDKVCVITDISLDHTNVLGSTIQEVASNKAGIITLHNPVFTYVQLPEAMEEIRQAARQRQADLQVVTAAVRPEANRLPLFQQRNFGLARAVCRYVEERDGLPNVSASKLEQAARTAIPARMETFSKAGRTIILDGAHNAQKLRTLRESLEAEYPGEPIAALVGFIKGGGRDLTGQLRELEPLYAHVIVTSLPVGSDHHNWYSAATLKKAAAAAGIMSVEAIPDHKKALTSLLQRPESVLVVTGSLYIHQHIRPLLQKLS